jgi:hypothetical protein
MIAMPRMPEPVVTGDPGRERETKGLLAKAAAAPATLTAAEMDRLWALSPRTWARAALDRDDHYIASMSVNLDHALGQSPDRRIAAASCAEPAARQALGAAVAAQAVLDHLDQQRGDLQVVHQVADQVQHFQDELAGKLARPEWKAEAAGDKDLELLVREITDAVLRLSDSERERLAGWLRDGMLVRVYLGAEKPREEAASMRRQLPLKPPAPAVERYKDARERFLGSGELRDKDTMLATMQGMTDAEMGCVLADAAAAPWPGDMEAEAARRAADRRYGAGLLLTLFGGAVSVILGWALRPSPGLLAAVPVVAATACAVAIVLKKDKKGKKERKETVKYCVLWQTRNGQKLWDGPHPSRDAADDAAGMIIEARVLGYIVAVITAERPGTGEEKE